MKSKSALYIAYHYPPILGSSGVHRTLAFTRYLIENNWQVSVLTSSLSSYDNWSESQYQFIPSEVKVLRAFGRNTAKQLSFKGKYFSWMALPDNWQSWILGGFFSGLRAIMTNKPNVIVSTYPIASAHIIAYLLHKVSGIPWVADLRDPMAQENYPTDQKKKNVFKWIEKKIIKHCHYAILTAPGAVEFYQKQYPEVPKNFWQLVPNGFDQAIFNGLCFKTKEEKEQNKDQKITLLHSGVIYPSERDPRHLFQAIQALKENGDISPDNFELRLRATGHDQLFQTALLKHGIDDIVQLAPSIPYKEALSEILSVDALLLLQAGNCDYQIPAKAYEYIKAKKPVLALTSDSGDTGKLLKSAGLSCIAPLNDTKRIKVQLKEFLNGVAAETFIFLDEKEINKFSRQYHASGFEALLKNAIA